MREHTFRVYSASSSSSTAPARHKHTDFIATTCSSLVLLCANQKRSFSNFNATLFTFTLMVQKKKRETTKKWIWNVMCINNLQRNDFDTCARWSNSEKKNIQKMSNFNRVRVVYEVYISLGRSFRCHSLGVYCMHFKRLNTKRDYVQRRHQAWL